MKRTVLVFLWGLVLVPAATPAAFAVWPPSPSLEDTEKTSAAQSVRAAIDKLERDERRLQDVLRDLKDDEEELKRRSGVAVVDDERSMK